MRRREAFTADPAAFTVPARAEDELAETLAGCPRADRCRSSRFLALYRAIAQLVVSGVQAIGPTSRSWRVRRRGPRSPVAPSRRSTCSIGAQALPAQARGRSVRRSGGDRRENPPARPGGGRRRTADEKKSGGPGDAGATRLEILDAPPAIAEVDVDTARVFGAPQPDRHERGASGGVTALWSHCAVASTRGTARFARRHRCRRRRDAPCGRRPGRAEGGRARSGRGRAPPCASTASVRALLRRRQQLLAARRPARREGQGARFRPARGCGRPPRPYLPRRVQVRVPEAASPCVRPRSLARTAGCEIPLSGRTPLPPRCSGAPRAAPGAGEAPECAAGRGRQRRAAERPATPRRERPVRRRARGGPWPLRRARIGCVVVDAVPPDRESESCGPALAAAAGGVHLPIADVTPAGFVDVVTRVA